MPKVVDYKPINISVIEQRADLLSKIREFFKQERVLEVDTPLLCKYAGTAVHLDPFICIEPEEYQTKSNFLDVNCNHNFKFLQTSPEYAMKRLLVSGSPDIFQICKAFRSNEIGNLHNPEFTILEWYRLGFDHHKLMENVGNLLNFSLTVNDQHNFSNNIIYKHCKYSYREIFIKYLSCDPIIASLSELKKLVKDNINLSKDFLDGLYKQDCQELLFNHFVEPNLLGEDKIWFIYDYPIEQAALSKIVLDQNNDLVAQRFEVYINGIELANGYHELLDVDSQKQRFLEDQARRKQLGKIHIPIDEYFMSALEQGLPSCSGVALGVDRLLMLKIKAKSLKEVILFPWEIA